MAQLKPCPISGNPDIEAEIFTALKQFRIYLRGAAGEPCVAEIDLHFSDCGIDGPFSPFEKAQSVITEIFEMLNRREEVEDE